MKQSDNKKLIKQCQEGEYYWVCFGCATKYSNNPLYDSVLTVHTGTCCICDKHKMVGPSTKLFGHYRSI